MRKAVRVLVLVSLLALLVPLAFTAAAQDEDAILRYPITTDPEHLNPFISDTIAVSTVLRNVYEGLVGLDARTGEFVPLLAESWEISDDGLTYTFNLREGVLFHDVEGVEYEDREVTADDILWNYELALNADEDVSILADSLGRVVAGAEEFTLGEEDVVSGLEVVDEYTFRITLDQPDRLFLQNGAALAITSPEAYEQLGDDFNSTPVGTGPYQFVEWLRQDRLELEVNDEYYREGLPANDGVLFINYGDDNTALLDYRNDQLDFLFSFPQGQRQAVIDEFSGQYNEKPGLHLRYFGFNMENGFFAENPLVRQAFNYALNRELIWNELEEGARFPADLGMLVPSMPASSPETVYTYDLDRAAELLAEAGFPNGEGMPTIELYVLSAIADELSIPVWIEDLRQLGVEVEVVVEEGATYWDSIAGPDVYVFINGWAAGVPDPADVFNFLILDGNGSMKYDNPEVNELLEEAMVTYDDAAREQLYLEAHNIIMADSVVVPSAYSKVTWLQKPWIEGFDPGGGGTYTAPLYEVTKSTE